MVEEQIEECWGENAAVTDSVVDGEGLGCLAVVLDGSAGLEWSSWKDVGALQ